jgi:acyl-coenzyme A synthetase/AMP-(fatty) acid ligase
MTDYEAERASFRLDVPERFNFVHDVLERRAADTPDGLALLSLDAGGAVSARHTWAETAKESRRMGHALSAQGVGKGDPVLMMPRIPEWYVAALGAIRDGAIPMPGTSLLTAKDIAYRIRQAGAVAAVTDSDAAAKVDAAGDLPTLRQGIVGEAPSDGWTPLSALLEHLFGGVRRGPPVGRS